MPQVNGPQIGQFCWYEVGTTDQPGAKMFYTEVFGWASTDFPMGPDEVYTMFHLNGRDTGAAYTLRPEQKAQGVPPHWMTYIGVADADASAAKATSLGGRVLMPPFDVFDVGRMAVIMDPTGAAFSIWQAKKHFGVGIKNELNCFGWSELMTRDPEAATKFYTGLFGWETMVSSATAGMPYTHWRVNGADIGGMMEMKPEWGDVPPHWLNYLAVADCDATAAKTTQLGGQVLVPPTDVPNVGRFAILKDPQGAVFAVIKLVPMHKG